MLAITWDDYQKYGCPNCGCDSAKAGHVSGGGSCFGTCRHCNLHFEIRADEFTVPSWKHSEHPINPADPNSESVMEHAFLVFPHPRKGTEKWHWEPKDERPKDGGEYWQSRGIGYDLSGFVKTKYAGERIHEMVKSVLGVEKPKTWLDYRENEPTWIQYKFSPDEFDLVKLDGLATDGIVTEDMLRECVKMKESSEKEASNEKDSKGNT